MACPASPPKIAAKPAPVGIVGVDRPFRRAGGRLAEPVAGLGPLHAPSSARSRSCCRPRPIGNAEGGTRTPTPFRAQRPERCVSTNFTTSALFSCPRQTSRLTSDTPYITVSHPNCQELFPLFLSSSPSTRMVPMAPFLDSQQRHPYTYLKGECEHLCKIHDAREQGNRPSQPILIL